MTESNHLIDALDARVDQRLARRYYFKDARVAIIMMATGATAL